MSKLKTFKYCLNTTPCPADLQKFMSNANKIKSLYFVKYLNVYII